MQVNIKEWIAFLCQMWWGRRKYADTITIFGHMLKNIGSVIQFEQLSNILKNIFRKTNCWIRHLSCTQLSSVLNRFSCVKFWPIRRQYFHWGDAKCLPQLPNTYHAAVTWYWWFSMNYLFESSYHAIVYKQYPNRSWELFISALIEC